MKMQFNLFPFAALAFAALALASCKKDKGEDPSPPYAGVTINGVTWSEFNVNTPGTFTAKAEDYGMFYQWGIKVGWSSADPLTPSLAGASWTYPISGAEGDVWTSANDPCPAGWRLPTKEEQLTLLEDGTGGKADKVSNEWISTGVTGRKFTDKSSGTSIFFPAAGRREYSDGSLDFAGDDAIYWSRSVYNVDKALSLYVYEAGGGQFWGERAFGLAVRCVRQ